MTKEDTVTKQRKKNGTVKMPKTPRNGEEDGQEVEIWWDFLEEVVADFKGFQQGGACRYGEGKLILLN